MLHARTHTSSPVPAAQPVDPATPTKHVSQPLWVIPEFYFILVSSLFWPLVLITYAQYNHKAHSSKLAAACDPLHLRLATCAHRGNAAELLQSLRASSRSSTIPTLLQQMTALWEAGITCFDFDVVQLADGEFIVGHPADLVKLANSSSSSGDSRSSSSSKEQKGLALTPGLLHTQKLAEIRDAGIHGSVAPLLQEVLQHFAKLRCKPPGSSSSRMTVDSELGDHGSSSSNTGVETPSSGSITHAGSRSSITPVETAAAHRQWHTVPVLGVELKGPAAASLEGWQQVLRLADAANITESIILFMRHQADSGIVRSSSRSAAAEEVEAGPGSQQQQTLLQLASQVRAVARQTVGQGDKGSVQQKSLVLMGLIVPDALLQGLVLADLTGSSSSAKGGSTDNSSGDFTHLAPAVIRAATGRTNKKPNSADATVSPTKLLQSFDVLSVSIKLPASVITDLAALKPVFAWTLSSKEDVKLAMQLGVDLGTTDLPVQQYKQVQKIQQQCKQQQKMR